MGISKKYRVVREDVYAQFITGATVVQASENLNWPLPKIQRYYTEFLVASARTKNDELNDRIAQIREIEKELFDNIHSTRLDSVYKSFLLC